MTRARLQRQHLHAGAPLDRPGRARPGDRSAGAVGRHGAVRRHHPGARPARAADRDGARSCSSATATISRAMRRSRAAIARAEGSDATIYAIGQGRAVRLAGLQKLLRRLASDQRRPRVLLRPTSEARDGLRGDPRGPAQPVSALRIRRRATSATARGTGSASKWPDGKYRVRARQGYRLSPGTDVTQLPTEAARNHRCSLSVTRSACSLTCAGPAYGAAGPRARRPSVRQSTSSPWTSTSSTHGTSRGGSRGGRLLLAVDGRPRRIASAQFIPAAAAPTGPAGADLLQLERRRGRRSADRARRRSGQHRRWTWQARDRCGAAVHRAARTGRSCRARHDPRAGPQMDFTSNHALVQTMLPRLVGQAQPPQQGQLRVGLARRWRIQRGDQIAIAQVIERECAGIRDGHRGPGLRATRDQRSEHGLSGGPRAHAQFARVAAVAGRAAGSATPSPKTLVLLSEGVVLERGSAEVVVARTGGRTRPDRALRPPARSAGVGCVARHARRRPAAKIESRARKGWPCWRGWRAEGVPRRQHCRQRLFSGWRSSSRATTSSASSRSPAIATASRTRSRSTCRAGRTSRFASRARVQRRDAPRSRTAERSLAETLRAPLLATDIGLKAHGLHASGTPRVGSCGSSSPPTSTDRSTRADRSRSPTCSWTARTARGEPARAGRHDPGPSPRRRRRRTSARCSGDARRLHAEARGRRRAASAAASSTPSARRSIGRPARASPIC